MALLQVGESLSVEFRGESMKALSDAELVESVVCLANRDREDDGWLLVGVEDDGTVTGAKPRHGSVTDPDRVVALIANRTRPSLSVRAFVVNMNGREVLAVQAPRARITTGTADGRYVRRVILGTGEPGCLPMTPSDILSRQSIAIQEDVSARIVEGTSWDDVDPLEILRLRDTIERYRGDAVLLAGKEQSIRRRLPTHEAAFQVLSDVNVAVNQFYRSPIVRTLEEMLLFLRARNSETEVMAGMFRIGIPNYSERAFREGVVNALVHRDYTRQGAVHVQWREDRIEISSPGGFPEGVHLNNLLVTPPRPRNPRLADSFKRLGLVERTGRGIDTIFSEQLRNGRPVPDYGRSTSVWVTLVIPGGRANLEFIRLVLEQDESGRSLSLDELLILNSLFTDRRIDTATAAKVIQKPEAETRGALERLGERGLIEPRGERRGRVYHLSAAVYRMLGQKAAYVRVRGFEPEQ
ncbi:MAG: ATP-binding protein, partial [Bacillota bacterium]